MQTKTHQTNKDIVPLLAGERKSNPYETYNVKTEEVPKPLEKSASELFFTKYKIISRYSFVQYCAKVLTHPLFIYILLAGSLTSMQFF